MPPEREPAEQAKLEWLRAAAKDGFDQLDPGEGITFESKDDLDAYVDEVRESSLRLDSRRT